MKITKKIVVLLLLSQACKQGRSEPQDAAVSVRDAAIDANASSDARPRRDGAIPDVGALDAGLRCPSYARPISRGTLESSKITELSGLVSSQRNPGVLWVHNDSGDDARVFAISETGTLLLEVDLNDVSATDIEDMALGEYEGRFMLYLGDIGDNDAERDGVRIYAVQEPLLSEQSKSRISVDVQILNLTYADGPHNAETLLYDPIDQNLWIVTKGLSAAIYRVNPAETSQELAPAASLAFPIATGGSISPDGRAIVVRGYASASLWLRQRGASIADAFTTTACRIPLASEKQGEAIAFASDNLGYWSASEGSGSSLFYYARNDTE